MTKQTSARIVALGLLALGAVDAAHGQSFVNFESGHVRPLAMAPNGNRLFAVNTPDSRLAVFDITASGLTMVAEVPVGMEPVAAASRINGGGDVEVWVVNHLSDSVSIVAIDAGDVTQSHVVRTLHVGDEPRDIVFAGTTGDRAFVTAAHRGQNRPGDPQLTTEGIGRADVWVFDADAPGADYGGTPQAILQLFGDTPRALAASPDGSLVYAAVFHSGNQTTGLVEGLVSANPGGRVKPANPPGSAPGAPGTGLIVKFDPATGEWNDEIGQDWSPFVFFDLPDLDVFRIDADALAQVNTISGVGTILFNMAVHPTSGKIYVANTEARNQVRFEGMDPIETPVVQGVKGHIAESRITVIDGTAATPRHLNPHIDYLTVPGTAAEIEQSLAFPVGLVFSADGSTVYVAGLGSEKVGVLSTSNLESASPVTKQLIEVGPGPSGLALDTPRNRLYVMTRFAHRVAIVDLAEGEMTDSVSMNFDPSPAVVNQGRRVLYDARHTSAHGDSACASCHTFGDFDSLAWDLGDPTGQVAFNVNPFIGSSGTGIFHPLKGPMTTQSLRGMANHGPMHWRGDRNGGTFFGDPLALDEDLAFKAFNVAFPGLLGRAAEISDPQMARFADFILSVHYPPNPIRALSNDSVVSWKEGVPGGDFAAGESFYFNTDTDGIRTCNDCHTVNPGAGFFGTAGLSTVEGETQEFKVPHLRNAYQKVGMFGFIGGGGIPGGVFTGDQVRGFGFLHDGVIDTLFGFVSANAFVFPGTPAQQNAMRRQVEEFMLALDSDLAPIVGQQVSATAANFTDSDLLARVQLLRDRADAGECDLIAKLILAGEPRGAVYSGGDSWQSDRAADVPSNTTTMIGLAATAGQEITFTGVPPGSGTRAGIDRDVDGIFDGDELDDGTDPGDPLSIAGAPPTVLIQSTAMRLRDDTIDPINYSRRRLRFRAITHNDPAANRIVPPAPGAAGDPTIGGATMRVYNSNGSGERTTFNLEAARWELLPSGGYQYTAPSPSSAVQQVKLEADKLIVKAGGTGGTSFFYTLDEPSQGRVTVRLALGSTIEWCAEGVPKRTGVPASTRKTDKVGRFSSQRRRAAPPACPVPPL